MGAMVSVYQGALGRVTLFDTNVSAVEHVHPQLHVMIKLSGCDSVYQVGDCDCPLTDDQMVLVNSWTRHGNWRPDDDPGTLMIAFYVEPAWMRTAMGWPVETSPPFSLPVAPVTPEIRRRALDIADILAAPGGIHEDALGDQVAATLKGIVTGLEATQTPRQRARPVDYRIRRAIALMAGEDGPRSVLKRLPKHVGLSRSSFYEQFKNSTGVPPGLYADGVTLDQAVRALVETDKTIGDIAADLGFSAQSHFTRFFKSKVCFTPSEFRHVACMAGQG